MREKLKVVIKKPNRKSYVAEIEPNFSCIEKIVDGFLDFVDIPKIKNSHLYIAIDDLGVVKRKPLNFTISELQYAIHGNAVAFGMSDDGKFLDLTENEIKIVGQYMNSNNFENSKGQGEIMSKKLKVIIKKPHEEAFVTEIDSGLNPLQKLVEGRVEFTEMPKVECVDITSNEESKINGMEYNFFLPEYKDAIAGPAVILGFNPRTGSHISLTDKQIDAVLHYIERNNVNDFSEVYIAACYGFDKLNRFHKEDFEL